MKSTDWNGNTKSVFSTLGASTHSAKDRDKMDYYATDLNAFRYLVEDGGVRLSPTVLEPCAGGGHLSEQIKQYGYEVVSKDVVQRDYPLDGVWDFLEQDEKWDGDIVLNPPYSQAKQFIEKCLSMIRNGDKVYAFLKLTFLESKVRRPLFDTKQLKTVYVSSSRLGCVKNGRFDDKEFKSSAVCYCWYEFVKGWDRDPVIRWIN